MSDAFVTISDPAPVAEKARALIADAPAFFENSYTKMQSVPREELEAIQRAALAMRVATQARRIPIVGTMVERRGSADIDGLDDVLPLMLQHTAFKSYPSSLLEKGRFGMLTRWLDKLTVHDLSGVDASACGTIDEWLDLLARETPLDPLTSSGSTGTMSFLPRDKHDWDLQCRGIRAIFLQTFGTEPTREDLVEPLYMVWPTYWKGHIGQFKLGAYLRTYVAGGRDDRFFPLYSAAGSADLVYLSARLRVAAARGDMGKVDVPPALLARRGELQERQALMQEELPRFVERLLRELEGERIYSVGPWNLFYDIATRGLQEGRRCRFKSNSVLLTGGGAKGMVQPEGWQETVEAFFGLKVTMGYGMTETTSIQRQCEHGHYHMNPWLIPYVLDPDTGEPCPRRGRQTGRAAFFDLCMDSMWGGILTGDEITVDWDTACPCGRSTVFIESRIQRFSEKSGGDDKITCAATASAHSEAMDYLLAIDAPA